MNHTNFFDFIELHNEPEYLIEIKKIDIFVDLPDML